MWEGIQERHSHVGVCVAGVRGGVERMTTDNVRFTKRPVKWRSKHR